MINKPLYNNYTDEELLDAFYKTHDNNLLGVLLPRYTFLLFGVAMKYLKNEHEADDAVQQVFLKTLLYLPPDIQNFKGWLYILMRNHCLQILRDKHIYHDESSINKLPAAEPENETPVYTETQIHNAIQQLGHGQQVCVNLFYLKKLSYQQIMKQTGYSYIQVKSYIQNGKRNLKQILLKNVKSA